MSPHFSGRSLPRLELTLVLGLEAIQRFLTGAPPEEVNKVGVIKFVKFGSIEELNAYVQGVEDALGFRDVHWVDQVPGL